MIIISDTSPLSNLLKIGQLPLLQQLYGTVIIPQRIYQEIDDWDTIRVIESNL